MQFDLAVVFLGFFPIRGNGEESENNGRIQRNDWSWVFKRPIGSMYGIFTYIYHQN